METPTFVPKLRRIVVSARRRTPGLRREEVAQLAGVSVTWYTWLEQKRPIRVSGGVLENIASALKLDPVERTQLFQLALGRPAPGASSSKEELSPLFQRLLNQIETFPAFIRGRRWDVLAWNEAARAFFWTSKSSQRPTAIWSG
jgi:transcriptional regulator with XRE-family HTH domain